MTMGTQWGRPSQACALIYILTLPEAYTTAAGLQQHYVVIPAKLRLVALLGFLRTECVNHAGKVRGP